MSELNENSSELKKGSGLLVINIVCWLITAATLIYYFAYPISAASPKYAVEARMLVVESMNIAVYIALTARAVFRKRSFKTAAAGLVAFAVFFVVNVVWQFLIWNSLYGSIGELIVG